MLHPLSHKYPIPISHDVPAGVGALPLDTTSSFPPSPDKVATGILELIMDTSKVGTVMTVTNKRGIDYFTKLPGEKLGQSTKAKL